MLAIIEAKELIESANYNCIDGVFTTNIPTSIKKLTNRTDILITRLNDNPTGFGNNDFFEIENTVEVQIFYTTTGFNEDLDQFEMKLIKLFKKNYWELADNKPPVTDPDTLQITKTIIFSRTKTL